MTETEVWKDIETYEGLYQVSNHGRIQSCDRMCLDKNGRSVPRKGKILSPYANDYGYLRIRLYTLNKPKCFYVSRLVAIAFIPPVDGKPEVDHIDRNKLNNHVSNLKWADDFDQSQNRDCIINAKLYHIETSRTRKLKSGVTKTYPCNRVRFWQDGRVKSKSFPTYQEALDFCEKLYTK
jgi:hypothetical protein